MIAAADDTEALIAEAEAITRDAAAKAEAKARRRQLREQDRRKKAEQRKRKAAEQAERERERKAEEARLRTGAEEARKVLLRKAAALRDAAGGSIRDCFEGLPEARDPRGLRHPLPAVLALVVLAMLHGKTRLVAITAWVAHAGQEILELAGCRHRGRDGRLAAPSPKTVTRCLGLAGARALADAVNRYLAAGIPAEAPAHPVPGPALQPQVACDGKMLRSSFVPPPEIRALRVYTRHIWDLTADRTRYWQRLEKLLEDALCKLTSVVSRLAGHQTARAVIEAMIAGERDPRVLAALGRGRMRNEKLPALAEALSGMRFGPQHAHAAASLLRAIDLLDAELRDLQEQVTAHLDAIPASWGVDSDGVTGPGAGRADAAALPAAGRLDEIPGLGKEAAAALIAEIGLDMSRFPTPQALVSWAGLTPTARQSGPVKGRGKKSRGNTYAKRITVLAAYAAANTDTFLGERFRRLAVRPGGGGRKKAGCAAGRSILIIVWHLLNDPASRYRDLGPGWHATHADRSRKARNARRQLEALGYDVIITLREDAA